MAMKYFFKSTNLTRTTDYLPASLTGNQRRRAGGLRTTCFSTKGYSLIMTLFAGTMVLITGLVTATLLGNQFISLANYKYASDAYAVAKAGVNAAVEELNGNNPLPMTQEDPFRGQVNSTTSPGQPIGSYIVTFVNNTLVSTGTVRDNRLSRDIKKKVTVNLDPQTGRFEESFSTTDYRDGSPETGGPTTAIWDNGQVRLPKITARTTPDAFATYTTDTLTAKATTTITVADTSGFLGDPDPDEVLISNTQSNSDGKQETARIQSVNAATTQITLKSAVQNPYSGKTSITRIPQYSSVNIASDATLTAKSWDSSSTTGGVIFFRSNDQTSGVQIRGTVKLSEKGYTDGNGPGAGGGGAYAPNAGNGGGGGGGAGYGSTGGNGGKGYGIFKCNISGGSGGISYGGMPTNSDFVGYLGSGGGRGGNGGSPGNGGGGRLKIEAYKIDIVGEIQSNGIGGIGATNDPYGAGGGGSGGSIFLKSSQINVTGILSAAGGGGGACGSTNYPPTNATDGNNGQGGSGGGTSTIQGSSGATATASPGAGGNGSNCGSGAGGNGFAGSGAGGGASGTNAGGGGGGAAGRIAIYYDTYNGLASRGVDGYYGPTGTEITGPYAYYLKMTAEADYGDGSDGPLNITSGTYNISESSNAPAEDTYIDNQKAVSIDTANQNKIKQATIYIYPAADSIGTITNLRMSTSAGPGTLNPGQLDSMDVSTGNIPDPRTFTWDNYGSSLIYNFSLNTSDISKTPRIDKIVIDYVTTRYNINYSTWRTN